MTTYNVKPLTNRAAVLAEVKDAFPKGTWVLSSTETGRYVGTVRGYVLNSKGIWVVKVGRHDWSSYTDELTLVDPDKARALVAADGEHFAGYDPALLK